MLMEKERELLVEYGKNLITAQLTKGTGGNLSIYDREKGYMAITPSGLDFFETEPEDIVIMKLDGEIVEGNRTPSSERHMHSFVYQDREDINSVIHAHTVYASIFACLRESIPPAHYMLEVAGGEVRCAEYATYGTAELGRNAVKSMKGRKAVLLANHGILAGEKDIANAFNVVNQVEYCANVYYRARAIGNPIIIDDEELKILGEKFKTYGQVKPKEEI